MMSGRISLKIKIIFILMLAFSILLAGCTTSGNSTEKTHENLVTMAWPRDIGEMNPHVYNPPNYLPSRWYMNLWLPMKREESLNRI